MTESSTQSGSAAGIPPLPSRTLVQNFGWMMAAALLLFSTVGFLLYETVINPGAAFRYFTSSPTLMADDSWVPRDAVAASPLPQAPSTPSNLPKNSAQMDNEYAPLDPFSELSSRATENVPILRPLAELAADEERRRAVERERRLRAELRGVYAQTIDRFKALESGVLDFRTSVKQTLGYSAEAAEPHAPELDRAILSHESVAEAWADIRNYLAQAKELDGKREALTEISSRLNYGPVTLVDKADLQATIGWIDDQKEHLSIQRANLEHIRVMMAVERTDGRLDSSDRRP